MTMKRIILTIALLAAGAVCAGAQDLSVLSKAARMAYDYLSAEGYKPTIDEEDDLLSSVAGMAACNKITQDKKLVQAYITDDGDVMLCTDTYIGSAGNMDEFIGSSITFMIRAVSAFRDEYSELLKD